MPTDVYSYQTLTYSYDEDYQTQGPLIAKSTLRTATSPMVMDVDKDILLKEAERLHSEIVSDLESESYYVDPTSKFVSDKINMFRRAIGYLDYPELNVFVSKYWESKEYSTSK